MKNKIIAAILLMGILWNGQMVYAEDTAVGEVIATESENSESTNAETTEMELERESESQGVVSTESAVTVISEAAVLMEAGTGTVIYEKNHLPGGADAGALPAGLRACGDRTERQNHRGYDDLRGRHDQDHD